MTSPNRTFVTFTFATIEHFATLGDPHQDFILGGCDLTRADGSALHSQADVHVTGPLADEVVELPGRCGDLILAGEVTPNMDSDSLGSFRLVSLASWNLRGQEPAPAFSNAPTALAA